MSFEAALAEALAGALSEPLPADLLGRLETLDGLLVQWSAKADLVGFRTAEERVRRYFAEPLAAGHLVPGAGTALDIGSGAGSPALPLAVLRPEVAWTLLEPRRKRSHFLEEAARTLLLSNVRVLRERFEASGPLRSLDVVTTRGVRLRPPVIDEVLKGLRLGGRLLWFSGEGRLTEARAALASRPGWCVRGPERLLAGGSARLLVVEKGPRSR